MSAELDAMLRVDEPESDGTGGAGIASLRKLNSVTFSASVRSLEPSATTTTSATSTSHASSASHASASDGDGDDCDSDTDSDSDEVQSAASSSTFHTHGSRYSDISALDLPPLAAPPAHEPPAWQPIDRQSLLELHPVMLNAARRRVTMHAGPDQQQRRSSAGIQRHGPPGWRAEALAAEALAGAMTVLCCASALHCATITSHNTRDGY